MGRTVRRALEAVSNALGRNATTRGAITAAKLEQLCGERDLALERVKKLCGERERQSTRIKELERLKLEAIDDSESFGRLSADLATAHMEAERTSLLIKRAEGTAAAAVEEARRAPLVMELEAAQKAVELSEARLAEAAQGLLEAAEASSRARAGFADAWEAAEQAVGRARSAAEAAGVEGPDPLDTLKGWDLAQETVRDAVDIVDRPRDVRERRHNPIANPWGAESIILPRGEVMLQGLIETARKVIRHFGTAVGMTVAPSDDESGAS